MNINLYNFAKKENSTVRPTGTGDVFSCTIKTPASIQAPTVELELSTVPGYNYAYISDLQRYYYVTGTAYNRGLWELSLMVDVLASFKEDIGATSLYIERASANKNGSLIDKMYPLTDVYTNSIATVKSSSTFSSGTILLNVINGDSNSGTTSYVMTVQAFGSFLDNIMVGGDEQISTWDSVLQSIKVTNYEPLRYLAGAYWLPGAYSEYSDGSVLTTLKLGNFTASGFTCYKASDSLTALTRTYTVTLPKHPQAATRGNYCNLEPFSEYYVDLGPFGTIHLDSAAMATAASVTINVYQDMQTGQGRAIVETNSGATLANVVSQWAVPIRISATADNTVSSIMQYAGGAAALIGGAVATGGLGIAAIAAGAGSMVSGLEGMTKGVISSTGSSGSITDHLRIWDLKARFYTIADDDNANNGRPLCKVSTPANLGGYMKAQTGLVKSTRAAKTEIDSVNAYMEGGFYYE